MRGVARVPAVRNAAASMRRVRTAVPPHVQPVVDRLVADGLHVGLSLPAAAVEEINAWAAANPVYADRDPRLGFRLHDRAAAERALGKPILVAQHFNALDGCPAVAAAASDPDLRAVAAGYLRSTPRLVGANLWWTFPVDALAADRDRHAHCFHRDVDDLAFLKAFYYLTPVAPGDGGHVVVTGSHRFGTFDRVEVRRFSDDEVAAAHDPDRIREITGPAGTGFLEDTFCLHKGLTPTRTPRLVLQFEFALHDYGVAHDRRDHLGMVPLGAVA